jgi:hypothetical protein
MKPFTGWPRWAVDMLRKVLVRTGLMPALLLVLDVECWTRDVFEFEDDTSGPGWACVAPRGWN